MVDVGGSDGFANELGRKVENSMRIALLNCQSINLQLLSKIVFRYPFSKEIID